MTHPPHDQILMDMLHRKEKKNADERKRKRKQKQAYSEAPGVEPANVEIVLVEESN